MRKCSEEKFKNKSLVKVGFASSSLNEVLPQNKPVREDIQANAAYFRQSDLECCWIALDFMDFDLKTIDHIKSVISKSCLLRPEHIHILTTHNHGAGEVEVLNIALLALKAAETVTNSKAAASEAFLRCANTEINEQLNYIRRIYVEEFAACSTLYFGPCASEKFDASEYLKYQIFTLLERNELPYGGKSKEASGKILLNSKNNTVMPSADETVAILHFEKKDGSPIGNICRFAAHAVCCNNPEYYSSDYPFYVRKYLTENLGGTTLFLNGPCGEIAPAIPDKISLEERRIGTAVASAAICALKGTKPVPINKLRDRTKEISLPVRNDLPETEIAEHEIKILEKKFSVMHNAPLSELKIIAEKINFLRTVPFLRKKWLAGDSGESEKRRKITAQLGLLTLNDTLILAFPGETFSSTAEKIQIESGLPNLITVTEHGRTLMYIPPEKDHTLGGYEMTCSITTSDAEQILTAKALTMLNR